MNVDGGSVRGPVCALERGVTEQNLKAGTQTFGREAAGRGSLTSDRAVNSKQITLTIMRFKSVKGCKIIFHSLSPLRGPECCISVSLVSLGFIL